VAWGIGGDVARALWGQRIWFVGVSLALWLIGESEPGDLVNWTIAAGISIGTLVSLIPAVTDRVRIASGIGSESYPGMGWSPRHTRVLRATALAAVLICIFTSALSMLVAWPITRVLGVSFSTVSSLVVGPVLSTALARVSPSVVAPALDRDLSLLAAMKASRRHWFRLSSLLYAVYLSCDLLGRGARAFEAWLPFIGASRVVSAVADAAALLLFALAWSYAAGKQYGPALTKGISRDGSAKLPSDDSQPR